MVILVLQGASIPLVQVYDTAIELHSRVIQIVAMTKISHFGVTPTKQVILILKAHQLWALITTM